MTRAHDDDFQGSFFGFEIDGVNLAFFTGCSGLSLEYDVIEFKEGNGSSVLARKRAGKPKYTEVSLKRGLTTDTALHDWFQDVVEAADATPYKSGSIVIYDRLSNEVARYNLENCWPSKLSNSDLTAGSDDVMVEEVTIQHEFLDWV
jgi:phage tail-like protein